MITHNAVRDTEFDRDEILEAMVIRQACRHYNREAASLATDKAKLFGSCAVLAVIVSAIVAIVCWL